MIEEETSAIMELALVAHAQSGILWGQTHVLVADSARHEIGASVGLGLQRCNTATCAHFCRLPEGHPQQTAVRTLALFCACPQGI
jgi:hypothetical protein